MGIKIVYFVHPFHSFQAIGNRLASMKAAVKGNNAISRVTIRRITRILSSLKLIKNYIPTRDIKSEFNS